MSSMFLGLAVVLLIGYILHLRARLKYLDYFVKSTGDENLALRTTLTQVERERSIGRLVLDEKNRILAAAHDQLAILRKEMFGEKEKAKPKPAVQVATEKAPAATSRKEEVPSRPSRVTHTGNSSPWHPVHQGQVYDDHSFSRDSGVCSDSSRSDSYDSGSSSSSDSGSSSSGGGCD